MDKKIPPRKYMTFDPARGGKSYSAMTMWSKSNKEPKLELKGAIIIDDPLGPNGKGDVKKFYKEMSKLLKKRSK